MTENSEHRELQKTPLHLIVGEGLDGAEHFFEEGRVKRLDEIMNGGDYIETTHYDPEIFGRLNRDREVVVVDLHNPVDAERYERELKKRGYIARICHETSRSSDYVGK